jgi:hypothetical protein
VIQVAPGTKVYLACRPVSMRYGFDGLAAQVANTLKADPYSGHLFLFRGKRGDYLTAAKDLRLDASPRVGVEALRALARWMVGRHGTGAATGASGELVRSAGRAPPQAGGADRADGAATARHGSGSSGDRP